MTQQQLPEQEMRALLQQVRDEVRELRDDFDDFRDRMAANVTTLMLSLREVARALSIQDSIDRLTESVQQSVKQAARKRKP